MTDATGVEVNPSLPGDERRGARRHSLNVLCKIWHRPSAAAPDDSVRVTDFSRGGARIETPSPLKVGDWVTVQMPQQWKIGSGKFRKVKLRGCVLPDFAAPSQGSGSYSARIQFANSPKAWLRFVMYRSLPWIGIVLMILAAFQVGFLRVSSVRLFWYHPVLNTYGLLVSVFLLSRIGLAIFFKPPERTGYEPTVTVIVACKNEEDSIYRTMECIFKSDYPTAKMQVIGVNDGSTDGTLREMERCKADYPSFEIIDFPKNLGKRHGMAAGARQAWGEVLLYIDSDSFVQMDTLREMVIGFADPEVGAVSGHANVENSRSNFLTKMQEVRYYSAFRIVKAAESLFSTVTCCSGCLAAYRRTFVMEVLDVWLDQRFMGQPATFGDDRSLTNYMLRHWKVVYNPRAVCTTIVPETWGVFFRQQLRWKKSWIRESVTVAARFMWKRHPVAALIFYLGIIFSLLSPLVVASCLIVPLLGSHHFPTQYVYGTLLVSGLYGLAYFVRFRDRLWVYAIFSSLFYMFVLVWQTWYALATVGKNHWGTR